MVIPAWVPTANNRKTKAAVRTLDAIVMRLINQRRAANEDTGDLLSMLLMVEDEDRHRMDDRQLRDEAVTLVSAGYETTPTR